MHRALNSERSSWPILSVAVLLLHDLPSYWRESESVIRRILIRQRPVLNQIVQDIKPGGKSGDDSILQTVIPTGGKVFVEGRDNEGHQSEPLIVIQLPAVVIVEKLDHPTGVGSFYFPVLANLG